MTTPNPSPTQRRFIDFQLSLQAVISGTVIVATFMVWMGWQAAQQTTNTAQLQLAVAKIEKRFDDRDSRLDEMRGKQNASDRATDKLEMRVDALERVGRK
jgi:hypothetical protein